jgi:hypothetical protein
MKLFTLKALPVALLALAAWLPTAQAAKPAELLAEYTARQAGARPAEAQVRKRPVSGDVATYDGRMVLDADAAYLAVKARDARFDGRLFVGVTSTGVYCRPVCRVRTPRRENCRFFDTRAQAEAAAFRPCLKCRPEIAPGLSQMDSSRTLADTAAG